MFLTMAYALSHLLVFLSVLLLPLSVVAQSGGFVTLGSSLSANEANSPWLSPSGDFAFGFYKLDNNLFLLSICSVNRQGEQLWLSEPLSGGVARGYMNDTGNFAIIDGNSQESWGSFGFPTDTLLPWQMIARGQGLVSRKSETNFSSGRFNLNLLDDGNLVLSTINLPSSYVNPPYYKSGTDDAVNSSYSGYQLVFNESGYLYVLRANGQKFMLSQRQIVSAGDFYHRVTLDFDGILARYYHPKNATGNDTWSVLWSEPDNICMTSAVAAGSGTCGYNSLCRLDTHRKRPMCECPQGYSLLDPNDPYGSCRPNFTLGCEEVGLRSAEDLYDIIELPNADWPLSDYQLLSPYDEDRCRNSCLQDCMCTVAIFRGDSCWKKKLPLANGRTDINDGTKAFIKIVKNNSLLQNGYIPIPEPKKKNHDTFVIVGSALLGTSVLVFVLCFGFFFIYNKKYARLPRTEDIVATYLHCFTYKELQEATGGFKEELGRGAFGIVYKGEMNTVYGNLVAVKKLDRMVFQEGEKEFKAEVNVIGQTHHKNLVRLLGFCNEGPHRLLVYEYMSNGTLSSFLFGDPKPSWNHRTEIALGVARGLIYLHEECSTQIIHCDIKPQNILLDDYYNARIADFGLAKLLTIGQSYTHTAIRGTKGYVAPEWFRNMPITVKVDVYSFGVLLLEIICCRKSVESEISEENAILTDWAYDCYVEGTLDALVGYDVELVDDRKKLERFVTVALWCIQEDHSLRPTMRKVIQMLEGVTEVTVPPCPSPFSKAG
ncbi:receptor-like protein kinase 1 [Actinidia rufa]|uniref:non-specific serine/threonine protein kinase n=1 Tax=Actinidia rufa TaxID=165716 RepID=A0A7J0H568_9ERIC|nr:receptor-like protein kinase 1 [Actinidia rufa]